MPYTVSQSNAACPVELPPLTPEPWGPNFNGPVPFWRQQIDGLPVDEERTAALSDWDVPISGNAGNQPGYNRPSWGIPWQIVREEWPKTRVWNQRNPVQWSWAKGLIFPWEYIPLPALVRRENDPGDWGDMKWRGWDAENNFLHEAISLGPHWLYGWSCHGYAKWDTSKPWDAQGQPRGVAATKVPYLPMIPRWEEVIYGVVTHAMHCSWPNYAPASEGLAGSARGSDGLWSGYPIRAGERLRLTEEAFLRLFSDPDMNRAEKALITGARLWGIYCGDKWTTDDPRNNDVRMHFTQDKRWDTGDDTSQPPRRSFMRLSDFEVVAQ